jgi:hypothetical protein
MKLRDIVIAVIILGVVGFILYNISTTDNTPELDVTPTPSTSERDFEERFLREIPEDVEKVELRSPSDEGEEQGRVSAIATRDVRDGTYMATILAGLEEPEAGEGYYAWVNRGEEYVLLGRLQTAKGGWLIDYESATDYSEYDRVVISEQAAPGTQPEDIVLEGTFE